MLVLKKLGETLVDELVELVHYLTTEEKLVVLLEPAAYAQVSPRFQSPNMCCFSDDEVER